MLPKHLPNDLYFLAFVFNLYLFLYIECDAVKTRSIFSQILTIDTPWLARTWWREQMKTFSAVLASCAGKSPTPGEFPAQRPVPRSFDVCFDLPLNKRWVNNREAGDLRRYRAHYDVIVMKGEIRCDFEVWFTFCCCRRSAGGKIVINWTRL